MAISPFLTKIAKGLNPDIERVEFEKAGWNRLGYVCRSGPGKAYWICIDDELVKCVHHRFFMLFHEVCHTFHFEQGYARFNSTPEKDRALEREADVYAIEKMRMIGADGRIKPECEICFRCITKRQAQICLKGRNL
jgi:hypothetical protein